jgi:hypothetical protein
MHALRIFHAVNYFVGDDLSFMLELEIGDGW